MTPRLGDLFPLQEREIFCKRNLIRGAVIRTQAEETIPPKIKCFVVWGLVESFNKIGVSFINREIAFIKKTWLQALQFPLLSKNNPFLSRNSFLDCSRIHEKNLKTIRDLVIGNMEVFLGNISLEDLLGAEKVIRRAKTIEDKLKKSYGFI